MGRVGGVVVVVDGASMQLILLLTLGQASINIV